MHETLRLPLGAPEDVPSHVTAIPVAATGSGGAGRPLRGAGSVVGLLRARSVARVDGLDGGGACGVVCGVDGVGGEAVGGDCRASQRRATRSGLSPEASRPLAASMACSCGTLCFGVWWCGRAARAYRSLATAVLRTRPLRTRVSSDGRGAAHARMQWRGWCRRCVRAVRGIDVRRQTAHRGGACCVL